MILEQPPVKEKEPQKFRGTSPVGLGAQGMSN